MINRLSNTPQAIESEHNHLKNAKNTKIASALLILAAIGSGVGVYFGVGHLVAYFLYAGGGLSAGSAVSSFGTGVGSIMHKRLAEGLDEELSGDHLLELIENSSDEEIQNFYNNSPEKIQTSLLQAMLRNQNYKKLLIDIDNPANQPSPAQLTLFRCFSNSPRLVAQNIFYLNHAIVCHIVSKMKDKNPFIDELSKRSLMNVSLYQFPGEDQDTCKARIYKTFTLFLPVTEKSTHNPSTSFLIRLQLDTHCKTYSKSKDGNNFYKELKNTLKMTAGSGDISPLKLENKRTSNSQPDDLPTLAEVEKCFMPLAPPPPPQSKASSMAPKKTTNVGKKNEPKTNKKEVSSEDKVTKKLETTETAQLEAPKESQKQQPNFMGELSQAISKRQNKSKQ